MNTLLLQNFPYRYYDSGDRGWIEKYNGNKWIVMYNCDCPLQLTTAMEDLEYTRWLDPEGVVCYREGRGNIVRAYKCQ